jgi:hypothetical protein
MGGVDGSIAGRLAEEHAAIRGPVVVVTRAQEHRRRRGQRVAYHVIFGLGSVVREIAGDQDRVHRPAQAVQVAHHPLGALDGLGPAADVDVADMRDEEHGHIWCQTAAPSR